jgi:hypothetical protein
VVARDEDPVAQEADVSVGMAGELEHAPAVDLVALPYRLRAAREADERPEGRCLARELHRLGLGEPMLTEIGREPP